MVRCLFALLVFASHAHAAELFIGTNSEGDIDDNATNMVLLGARTALPVVDVAASTEGVAIIRSTGIRCDAGGAACWRRVLDLAGAEGAWVLFPASSAHPARLFHFAGTASETPVLRLQAEGVRNAMVRLRDGTAAVVLSGVPDAATTRVDRALVRTNVLENLTASTHLIEVQSPLGVFVENVKLQKGEVRTLQVVLTTAVAANANTNTNATTNTSTPEIVIIPVAAAPSSSWASSVAPVATMAAGGVLLVSGSAVVVGMWLAGDGRKVTSQELPLAIAGGVVAGVGVAALAVGLGWLVVSD
jgi:hypothetical protein